MADNCERFEKLPADTLKTIKLMLEKSRVTGLEYVAPLDEKLKAGAIVEGGRVMTKLPPKTGYVYAAGKKGYKPTTSATITDINDMIENERPVICRSVVIAGKDDAACFTPTEFLKAVAKELESLRISSGEFRAAMRQKYGKPGVRMLKELGERRMASELAKRTVHLDEILEKYADEVVEKCSISESLR